MSDKTFQEMIADAVSTAVDANIERLTQLQLDRERYLSIPQVAELASVSRPTVRSWISLKHQPLPAYRVGRDFRIRFADFQHWFERFKIEKEKNPFNIGPLIDD